MPPPVYRCSVEIDDRNVTLQVITNKDLSAFENSFYAYQVYVAYRPDSTTVTSEFDDPGRPHKYPFSVFLRDTVGCNAAEHCTRWAILREDFLGMSLNDYEYKIERGDSIELRIGGGTKHGTWLRSNVVEVAVE